MLDTLKNRLGDHRLNLALATVSAVLYFVGFCGFDQFYLSWFCLVPILWAIDDEAVSPRAAFFYGWLFGTVTVFGGYTWLVEMLRNFGGLNWALASLTLVLFSLAHGLLWAIWIWLTHHFSVRRKLRIVWTAPVALVVCEWLFPSLFPTYLANSQYEQLLFIQSLDLIGPLGSTFILALVSSTLYRTLASWRGPERRPLPTAAIAVCTLVVTANFIYGWLALTDVDDTVAMEPRSVKVGVVQASLGMFEKHEKLREGVKRHQQQSLEVEALGADLIVWPESGFNYSLPTGIANVKNPVLADVETPILFGGLRVDRSDGTRRVYNSAWLTDASGNVVGTYDKTFLLAFGEYMPFGDLLPILYELSPYTSHFERGTHTNPLSLNGISYGILICYEDVLTEFVRKVMQSNPDILVNLTNDAWFGKSREPYIHLALATFRAVEQRRFLIRSTNTGVSAVIDPVGRILEQTPVYAQANIVRDVKPMSTVTVYQRFGHWVGWLCLLVLLFWGRGDLKSLGHGIMRRLMRHDPKAQ